MEEKNMNDNWIQIGQLPTSSMKVRWICEDGVEDVGFYFSEPKEFVTWDPRSEKMITHWKPFDYSEEKIKQCCSPPDGFYLGMTCPKCNKSFRTVNRNEQ